MTSHVSGARLRGSSLMRPCRCVVPVRGRPMMNTGAVIRCRSISEFAARSVSMRSKLSSRLTRYSRTVIRPSVVSLASS